MSFSFVDKFDLFSFAYVNVTNCKFSSGITNTHVLAIIFYTAQVEQSSTEAASFVVFRRFRGRSIPPNESADPELCSSAPNRQVPIKTHSWVRLPNFCAQFLTFFAIFRPEMVTFLQHLLGNSWNTAPDNIVLGRPTP